MGRAHYIWYLRLLQPYNQQVCYKWLLVALCRARFSDPHPSSHLFLAAIKTSTHRTIPCATISRTWVLLLVKLFIVMDIAEIMITEWKVTTNDVVLNDLILSTRTQIVLFVSTCTYRILLTTIITFYTTGKHITVVLLFRCRRFTSVDNDLFHNYYISVSLIDFKSSYYFQGFYPYPFPHNRSKSANMVFLYMIMLFLTYL